MITFTILARIIFEVIAIVGPGDSHVPTSPLMQEKALEDSRRDTTRHITPMPRGMYPHHQRRIITATSDLVFSEEQLMLLVRQMYKVCVCISDPSMARRR